jgi:lysophospholipase L1-like esterase
LIAIVLHTPTPSLADLPATLPSTIPATVRTLYVIGDDSATGSPADWVELFTRLFDPSKLRVVHNSQPPPETISLLKPGDCLLIQTGPGEQSPGVKDLPNIIRQTRDKQALPIVLSPKVKNVWKDGQVDRGSADFTRALKQAIEAEGPAFIDLTSLVADRYQHMGESAVKGLFSNDSDTAHSNAAGAELTARAVISGFKALHENGILRALPPAVGREIGVADPKYIRAPKLAVPKGAPNDEWFRWLNLPEPADPALPNVFLIGDSTVRNGRGDGVDGQWGWGDAISVYFDPAKVNLVNRAVGGTGARTYDYADRDFWGRVLAMVKPGDVVIMQFGTNDNGARGALPGTGDETQIRNLPGSDQKETVHTYGWYLRKYIADARAKGATPIVCTLVPRNAWAGGKIARPPNTHADWARQVARDQNVALLDLNERIAQRYDPLGQQATTALFADKRLHTGRQGAEISAQCVIEALKSLPDDPVAKFLRPEPAAVW